LRARRHLALRAATDQSAAERVELIGQLQGSERTSLLSILLEGPAGAGKTALAATLALQSSFPFIKLVSPNALVGMSESAKASTIARVFDDAHKSPLSLIVLD